MPSAPFPDQYIKGKGLIPSHRPGPFVLLAGLTCLFSVSKKVTLAGFEPPASQVRSNINQPALLDLL